LTYAVKTLWFVSLVVVTAALTIGGALIITLQSTRQPGAAYWLAIGALTIFVCGPVLLAAVAFYGDVKPVDARRSSRGYLRAVLVLEVLAAAAIVAYAILEETGPWVPIAFVGVGAAIFALVVYAGPRIAAKYHKPPERVEWAPITRAEIARGVRTVALWLVGTLAVLLVILTITMPDEPVQLMAVSLQCACVAGAVAGVAVSTGFSRRLAAVTGGDRGLTRRISDVVIRGKDLQLDDADTAVAAQYAAVWQTVQPFQAGFVGLLFLSSAASQLGALASGSTNGLSVPVLILLAAATLILCPLTVLQIRRARRYAREHAHLLPEAAAAGYDREQSPRR
jgi:hypothetical protein